LDKGDTRLGKGENISKEIKNYRKNIKMG